MPKVEVESFNGDFTKYRAFTKTFDATVASRAEDDNERLLYLMQFTTDIPHEVVRSCIHMPTGGYQQARKLLDKRYGRNTEMLNSYVDKILSFPVIKSGDINSLDKFSPLLTNPSNAIQAVKPGHRGIEDAKTIRQMVSKLPFSLQERFRRLVYRTEDGDDEVDFQTLVDFIANEV